MARVFLEKVNKVFNGGVKAVQDLTLEIRDREFMVLVGPSGCGKSTTLRMIAGLEEISSGTIQIGDRVVNNVPPKDRDIAMVFQNYALYPHMTAYENMAFGLKLRKMPKAEIDQRVREAAAILDIEPYLDRLPKALSGGQRQRVALGRAIVRKPAVFLFDEPLSNLDAKMRVQMRTEIAKLHRRLNTTMIYVTHDQIEAMTMGDRICVMEGGREQQTDRPLELYDNPANAFVAGFIGTPPTNFFRGKLERDGDKLSFVHHSLRLPLTNIWREVLLPHADTEVLFGVRPENLGSEAAEHDPEAVPLTARVELLEPMGATTYVYMNTGDPELCIGLCNPYRQLRAGTDATFALSLKKTHFFDATTGRRII